MDFTAKGVPRAWGRYCSAANRRTDQRVFGWWLAYPWALLEGTVDTAVRVPLGLAGTVLGTVWGSAVVPVYYAVNSTAKGTWHLGVDAVLIPVAAGAWNTVVAPPLALAGQKPAPARADGFWLRRLDEEERLSADRPDVPIRAEDVEALVTWGQVLLSVSQPYEARRTALQVQADAEVNAVRERTRKAEAELRREEANAVESLIPNPAQQQALDYLRDHGFDARRTSRAMDEVRDHLRSEAAMSPPDVHRSVELLRRYPPVVATNRVPLRPKTDPMQRSLELIDDLD